MCLPRVSDAVPTVHVYSNVYSADRVTRLVRSSGDFVNWVEFAGWLRGRGLRPKYVRDMVGYARRYGGLLFEGRLSSLDGVNGSRTALSALANLSKFCGQHGEFRKMREESGLLWSKESTEGVFEAIYGGRQAASNTEDWLSSVKGAVDRDIWFPVAFMALTGLRTSEAIDSLNKIAAEGLGGGYFNKDLGVLEHFRYGDVFLRKTKKAFFSIVGDGLFAELQSWRQPTSYSRIRKRLLREGLACRLYDLRRLFATNLRMSGVEVEIVDMLEGRLGGSIFVRSYLRPDVRQVIEKIRGILEPWEARWLS